ncbi:MAG TPA: SCO family protein [Solirubrobacteraceae bacterium]|jgi:protein SCO1/2
MRNPGRFDATLTLLGRAAIGLALAVALPGCGGGAARDSAAEASPAGASSGRDFDGALLPVGLTPHPFTLTDQDGRRVSLREFQGRVVILVFLYSTSQSVSPLIAQQVRGALDELGSDARNVSALAISVDPAADTPAHVRAFLRANSLTGRLEYLTGSAARLRPVWHAYRIVPASAGERAYEQGALVLLLDRTGAKRVEFPLEELTPEALAHDVRELQGAP